MGNYEKEMAARGQVMKEMPKAADDEDTRSTIVKVIDALAKALVGEGAAAEAQDTISSRQKQLDELEREAMGE